MKLKNTIHFSAAALAAMTLLVTHSLAAPDDDKRKMRDSRLANQVEVELAERRTLSLSDIDVSAENQKITLDGTVENEEAKDRAMQIARSVTGVQDVENNLNTDANAFQQEARTAENMSDEQLAKMITEKLAEELPYADAVEEWAFGWEVEGTTWEFDVDVDDGDVTLEGDVGSYSQFLTAFRTTRDVAGVMSVNTEDLEIENDFGRYDPFDYDYWDYDYDYGYEWDDELTSELR